MYKEEAEMFTEVLAQSDTPNMAYLLGAAVVLDSYFFKEELRAKKWTDEDTVVH